MCHISCEAAPPKWFQCVKNSLVNVILLSATYFHHHDPDSYLRLTSSRTRKYITSKFETEIGSFPFVECMCMFCVCVCRCFGEWVKGKCCYALHHNVCQCDFLMSRLLFGSLKSGFNLIIFLLFASVHYLLLDGCVWSVFCFFRWAFFPFGSPSLSFSLFSANTITSNQTNEKNISFETMKWDWAGAMETGIKQASRVDKITKNADHKIWFV